MPVPHVKRQSLHLFVVMEEAQIYCYCQFSLNTVDHLAPPAAAQDHRASGQREHLLLISNWANHQGHRFQVAPISHC